MTQVPAEEWPTEWCEGVSPNWPALDEASKLLALHEMHSALSAIFSAMDGEIAARFRTHHCKSEEQLGRNSAIYHLMSVPRNIACNSLERLKRAFPQIELSL
jgi:hypothetical protein